MLENLRVAAFCRGWGEGLGFELRALCLESRALAIPPVHFALVVLEMGVS
jgi:hypothetical protein